MTRSGETVQLTTVLQPSPAIAWVAIGEEVVVHRVSPPSSFVLNSVAGLLWRCLDGVSPLGDIFADMAEAFGVDVDEVERDCIPVATVWNHQHLVQEVRDG